MPTSRHPLQVSFLVAALAVALPPIVAAQRTEPTGVALDRWQPGHEPEAIAGVNTAERPLLYSFELWAVPYFANNLLEVADDLNGITGSLVGPRLGLHLGSSMCIWPRLQLGLHLPLVLYQARGAPVSPRFGPVDELFPLGLGDLNFFAKYHLLSAEQIGANLALMASMTTPTNFPRDAYLGERWFGFAGRLLLSRQIQALGLAAELGYHWRPTTEFLDATIGPEFRLGLGASYDFESLVKLPIEVAAASHMGLRHDAPFGGLNETPNEVLLEVRYRWLPLEFSAGVGAGVVAGVGTPDVRALLGVRFSHREPDRDGDRIPDRVDACPDDPEDHDWVEDGDGCPEQDRDGDDISDRTDRCPDKPENFNGYKDDDGCPDTRIVVEKNRLLVMEPVLFEFNKAVIKPESTKVLDEVATILEDNPQIELLAIEGHTDSDGGLEFNDALSQNRANAVRDYLVGKGIAAARLTAKGYGERRPVASNDTAQGKALNRRVEFLIVQIAGEDQGT